MSSRTYGCPALRNVLGGCTAALGGGNGGAKAPPSLLGETMPRFNEVEDGCSEEALASSTGGSHGVAYGHETLSW